MTPWTEPVSIDEPRDRGSKKKLQPGAQRHYVGDSAFERIARVVCRADCLPRKELYESWEMAKRVRRKLRGTRVIDLACGHGLLAYTLAVIMPRVTEVLAVDRRLPPSSQRLKAAMEAEWPELAERVRFQRADLRDVPVAATDIVVCAHGCGSLTDRVLDLAVAARSPVAVLPCCSDHSRLDGGGLDGWLHADLAIDVVRALRLRDEGYKVWTQHIPAEITPKNRILLGQPPGPRPDAPGA
ncbi:MAG: methyltransferase [Planctomycetota bacterium]|nr:methyltransferase [Planctomycetota bacterium]